jgi:anaerobic selenocysteine-containing dehydrogenase
MVRTTCAHNCGGRAVLDCTVQDGRLIKVETGPHPDSRYTAACVRCLAIPKWVYSPERLRHPLRRVGERGDGRFERISWDEAIQTIASRLKGTRDVYGPGSVAFTRSSGISHVGGYSRIASLLQASNLFGGVDMAVHMGLNAMFGNRGLFGQNTNEWTDLPNAKMIIVWGHNPAETSMTTFKLMLDAQAAGSQLVVIDPRYSPTARHADWWLAVRPGSDTALILSMLHVVLAEGLMDRQFALCHSVAPLLVRLDNQRYLREADCVDGGSDARYMVWDPEAQAPGAAEDVALPALEGAFTHNGIPTKTTFQLLQEMVADYAPEATAALTGIPPSDVRDLAIQYAHAEAATISFGYGCDRYYHADLVSRAAGTLAVLTGNVGKPGGCVGVVGNSAGSRGAKLAQGGPKLPDWAKATGVPRSAIGNQPLPIRALFMAGDELNQRVADQNRMLAWFQSLDFIVVADHFWQTSARWADIVLPASTFLESNEDLVDVQTNRNSILLKRKVIEPLFESKPDFEIEQLLGHGMGYGEYFQDKPEDIIRQQIENSADPALADITLDGVLAAGGSLRLNVPDSPRIHYGDLKFGTPTGRAEFYIERLAPYGEALPVYKDDYEASPRHPLAKEYPLVLIQTHARQRAHSSFSNSPWLLEIWPEPVVEMNPEDGARRGVQDGDWVEVFNQRGSVTLKVLLTPDYPRGLCNIPQGWKAGQYRAGHMQTLTNGTVNPAQTLLWGQANMPLDDTRVDIRKAEDNGGDGDTVKAFGS